MISSMMVRTFESLGQPAELLDSGRALASKAQQFLTFLKVRSLQRSFGTGALCALGVDGVVHNKTDLVNKSYLFPFEPFIYFE